MVDKKKIHDPLGNVPCYVVLNIRRYRCKCVKITIVTKNDKARSLKRRDSDITAFEYETQSYVRNLRKIKIDEMENLTIAIL